MPGSNNQYLSLSPVAHVPARAAPRFLSLAPATSPSYPQKPTTRSHGRAAIPEGSTRAPLPRQDSNGYRILKLGPVHYGEHPGQHKADFHEVILQ
ncbi:Fc.00g016870.m01.CDS01 [Cosmosporella sp. VM-42]